MTSMSAHYSACFVCLVYAALCTSTSVPYNSMYRQYNVLRPPVIVKVVLYERVLREIWENYGGQAALYQSPPFLSTLAWGGREENNKPSPLLRPSPIWYGLAWPEPRHEYLIEPFSVDPSISLPFLYTAAAPVALCVVTLPPHPVQVRARPFPESGSLNWD